MYIDPSSGGMLFQVLAVLFGLLSGMILFFSSQIKSAYRRVLRFFRERGSENTSDPEPDPATDQDSTN